MKVFGSVLSLCFILSIVSGAPQKGTCTKDESKRVNEDFLMCNSKALSKFREGVLSVCDFFEESINHCAHMLLKCAPESKIE